MKTRSRLTIQLKAWINTQIKTQKPGYVFPTAATLSKTWKVSPKTVNRIFIEYRENGLIWRIPGKGTILPNIAKKPSDVKEPKTSVETTVEAIYQCIRSGEFKKGTPLPSLKYMCQRFKIASATATKAYQSLRAKGIVTKIGKTFWVGKLRELATYGLKKEVFLFSYDSNDFTRVFTSDMLSLAYQQLEAELRSHGFAIRFEDTSNLSGLMSSWAAKGHTPYGLIFFGIRDYSLDQILPPLERHTHKLRSWKTSVLFDWQGTDWSRLKKIGTIVNRGNVITTFARTLGEYIIQQGFTEAQCFFEGTTPAWTKFAGFIQVPFRLWRELKHLEPSLQTKIIFQRHNAKLTFHEFMSKEIIPRININDFNLDKYEQQSVSALEKDLFLTDHFEHIFTQPTKPCIWIFSKDADALQALKWAQQRRIRIPNDLSIIGLENDPHFFHHGISYCGPDWQGIGYLMAHSIMRDIPIDKTRLGFIRTKAQIIERLTTK